MLNQSVWSENSQDLQHFCEIARGNNGQVIPKSPFNELFQKTNENIWQISALESKQWSNQQEKGTFLCITLPI